MTTSDAAEKMIKFYKGNQEDINHFLKVWSFARIIGESEKLDEKTLHTLELTAIVHDISCPLCREKYGNTDGRHQEEESEALVKAFFEGSDIEGETLSHISWLVCNHHTYINVDSIDYRILLEADYLVNAGENKHERARIISFRDNVFRTKMGIRLLDDIYLSPVHKEKE